MLKHHKKYILFILLFIFNNSYANYVLHDLPNLNNQLSNNAILSMCQDYYGFMWFGSYDGLNFYDGREVKTFRFEIDNPYSISGNSIHNITIADENHLWISTQLGLDKFSLLEQKVVESYHSYKRVQYIAINNKTKETWILGKNDYICYYNNLSGKGFEEIPFTGMKMNDVHTLFVDENGQLCLINKQGELYFINLDNRDTEKSLIVQKEIFHPNRINNLFQDGKQIFFNDDKNDLYIYNKSNHQKDFLCNISEIINQYGNSLVALTSFKNEIYIAFLNGGLLKLNLNNKQWNPINSTIGIFSILKDKNQEAIWVATDGRGVGLYYREENSFGNILLKDLPFTTQRPVRAIYTDENNDLWIGSKGDGITKIKNYHKYSNSQIPSFEVENLKQGGFIYCFERSRCNKFDLWIGGDILSYYSYVDQKIYDIVTPKEVKDTFNDIHNIVEVNDSTLWVTSDGLWKVNLDKRSKPYKLKNVEKQIITKDGSVLKETFFSVLYDGKSKLSLGSRIGYGILEYNVDNLKYNYQTINKEIGDIICLYAKEDSILYVGTSAGLTIETKTKNGRKVQQLGRRNGIVNDMIHGILEDATDIIWLSTNKGLVKYNPKNNSFLNFQTYKIGVSEFSDGAYWHCPISKRLFFGGINGLTWIEPNIQEDESERYAPNVIFTKLKMQDKTEILYDFNNDNTKKIILPNTQSSFEISFTTLDYIGGDNYDYSYMLQGYDTTWVSIQKSNNIKFIKIPSGKYTLNIKYQKDVINVEDKIFSIPITILPPWYQTTVAYIIYIIFFLLCISSLYLYVRWRFHRKQEILTKQIKRKEQEMLYESKMSFFTNITHELFTPLTLINGALEYIQATQQTDISKKYINIMQNNVLTLNELIQEILDYRKIEEKSNKELSITKVQVTNLIFSIIEPYYTISKYNNINIETTIGNDLYWYTDKKCLQKIITNLVSNAFKYTSENGKITIDLSIEENSTLIFTICNTGKGIAKDKLKKIFNRFQILESTDVNANNQLTARNGLGLYICYNMTKRLNGDVNVDSEINKFTRFTVKLPMLNHIIEEKKDDATIEESITPKAINIDKAFIKNNDFNESSPNV